MFKLFANVCNKRVSTVCERDLYRDNIEYGNVGKTNSNMIKGGAFYDNVICILVNFFRGKCA